MSAGRPFPQPLRCCLAAMRWLPLGATVRSAKGAA